MPEDSSQPQVVCIPLKVDAFVLNTAVADDENVRVAPITQPNYTFLRMDNDTIQNDVLAHTDLHQPDLNGKKLSAWNSRVTDLGTSETRQSRLGVYVSWTLPHAYRSGAAGTNTASSMESSGAAGFQPPTDNNDFSSPDFRPAPNRWMLLRCIDPDTLKVDPKPDDLSKLLCQAWVIESDRLTTLDQLSLDVDLQVDVSPYVQPLPSTDTSSGQVNKQAEVFIGYKYNVQDTYTPGTEYTPLSILNSANHLFADYQQHNSNVFSTVDDLSYMDNNTTYKINSATISYYVLGWHQDALDNLFFIDPKYPTKVSTRMATLKMAWNTPPNIIDTQSSNLLCHGAIYGVPWDANNAPIDTVAQAAATSLQLNTPVAVGSSSMDSLMAYIHSHTDSGNGDIEKLEAILIKIQSLLIGQDDGIDALMQAQDEQDRIGRHFTDGGKEWHIKATDSDSYSEPSDDVKANLQEMNELQRAIDNYLRCMQFVQRELFTIWWKWVSGASAISEQETIQAKVALLHSEYQTLLGAVILNQGTIDSLNLEISTWSPGIIAESSAKQPFAIQRDPTLLIAGIQTGWAHDFLDALLIRTPEQSVVASNASQWPDLPPLTETMLNVLNLNSDPASGLANAASQLLLEFAALYDDTLVPTSGQVPPLYHDQADNPPQWRDRWYAQPWLPLFIEWEAEYFHIPYDLFSLEPRNNGNIADMCEWGIDQALSNQAGDIRALSGRMLFLPQASRTLANSVKQVLANFPNNDLSSDDITFLKDESHYYELPYLAGTMSGFYSHLTTLVKETHIKPNIRRHGQALTPMDAAVSASKDINLDADILSTIGIETDITPYGAAVSFPGSSQNSPFKPATHGQFRFIKINVIDKFGRAICALNPNYDQEPHVAPILGDYFKCQTIPGSSPPTPNTILQDMGNQQCEFAQVPPVINQEARLNAAFLLQDTPSTWRDSSEWENPVYGWVILNYADNGIQFFQSDGTFYRELQLGGPSGTVESAAWAPFEPPKSGSSIVQLEAIIQALTMAADKGTYLQAFFDMASQAFGSIKTAPDDYSQFMNSLVGRPLALVNMGLSLELSTAPLENQSIFTKGNQPMTLLDPTDSGDIIVTPSTNMSQTSKSQGSQSQYQFPVKIGDKERPYDGLIGYWTAQADKVTFEYDEIFTYWPTTACPKTVEAGPPAYIQTKPFFVKPLQQQQTNGPVTAQSPIDMSTAYNSQWEPISALIDPFTPVHFYTSTLPTASVTLPHWITERAMTNMTSFFHIGPILLPQDVPALNSDYIPDPNYDLSKNPKVGGNILIPALKTTRWNWMQPYDLSVNGFDLGTDYMLLGVSGTDGKPRYEKAPYTAVEGYLQMSKAVASGPSPASSS